MNSTIILGSISVALFAVVAVIVTPHVLRVMSDEQSLYIASKLPSKAQVKLRQISTSDLLQQVRSSSRDTVIIHLWNTWHERGTCFFDTLTHYAIRKSPGMRVLDVCTDMTGIRQMKASAIIAERYGVRGISLALRCKPSLFDLHNRNATSECLSLLTGRSHQSESPAMVFLNRRGEVLKMQTP